MSSHEEAHLRILKIVEADPDISQHQLAEKLGISLGKTNFLLWAMQEGNATLLEDNEDDFSRETMLLEHLATHLGE